MKITYPSHPLEKLFYRPPLIMGCSMEDEEEIIDAYESESAIFEMEEEASWSLGDSEVEHAATPTPEPDPKAIDATEWDKPDQWSFHNSSLIADTLAEPEIADMLAEPEISDGISHTPEELPTSSVRDESVYRLPHGWLKADHSEPYDPTGWFVRSSSDDDWQPGEYATDKSNMVTSFEQLLLNYDSSTSSASGRAEENAEHTPEFSGEEEDKVDDDKSDWKDDDDKGDWKDDDDKGDWKDDDDKGDEKHDDVVDPTDDLADTDDDIQGLGEQSWPVIDSKEKFRCQQFGVCGTPSSSSFITAPAVNLSTTTMWSTNKSWSLDVRDENVLERKQSNFIMFLVGSENNHSVKFLPSDLPSADETESKGAGNILYEQLDVIRKLPQWDRLNKTLELLSNMGDLIAGFPELTKLHPLKRWYEQRLNINRHMTLKYKKQLINESKAAWNISRPKFTNILIPRIKFTSKKTTGNDRDTIKQNIKYAKQKYTTKLKEMAISNARDMYLDTLNDYFDNPLSKKFKQTFFAYYPAKEDNCTFEDPPRMIEKNIKF